MMLHKDKIGFLLILLLYLAACNPEDDVKGPVIEFIEPDELGVFMLPDTMQVRAHITDNDHISSVMVNLLDHNNVPVVQAMHYYPSANDYFLETSLVLDDKSLETGSYYLQVVADDGTNSSTKYREISIHEITAEILGYMAVTAPVSFTSTISRLNLNFVIDSQMVIPQQYLLAGANSFYEQFYFVSDEPSVLMAIDPFSFENLWEMNAAPPRIMFTDIFNDEALIFSTANGDAGIIDEPGTIILRTPPYDDKSIQCLAADEKYIYAGHRSLDGNINQLTVYYRVTGVIRVQELLSAEILGLVPVNGEIMVFFPSGANIGIMIYNPEDFTISANVFLESEIFRSAEKISENQVFIVTESRVVSYNADNQHFTDFIKEPFNFCRYDKLNDAVFLGKDLMVFKYDMNSGELLNVIPFSEKVLDFQILYNK